MRGLYHGIDWGTNQRSPARYLVHWEPPETAVQGTDEGRTAKDEGASGIRAGIRGGTPGNRCAGGQTTDEGRKTKEPVAFAAGPRETAGTPENRGDGRAWAVGTGVVHR